MTTTLDMVKGQIQRDFEAAVRKIPKPTDTIAGAQRYAQAVGDAMVRAFRENIGDDILVDGFLTPEMAEELVRNPMINGWKLVTSKTAEIQTAINGREGYHVRAMLAKTDESRVSGMVTLASEKPFAEVSTKFYQAVPNLMRSSVDKTVRQNFTALHDVGVPVEVVRIPDAGACKWCQDIAKAGPYNYDDVKRGGEVWLRHLDCGCVIETRIGKRSQRSYVRLRDKDKQQEINAEISEERKRT